MYKGIYCTIMDAEPNLKGFRAIKNTHIRETMSLEILEGVQGYIRVGGQRATRDRTLKAINTRTGKPKFMFHITGKPTQAYLNGELDHLDWLVSL